MTFIDFVFHLEPRLTVLLRPARFMRRFSRSTRSSRRVRVSISSSTMASFFRAITLLLAKRVRKNFWQRVDTAPWDKFSPDHLVGVIPDDLNFDASLFPSCPDHRPPSTPSLEKTKRPPGHTPPKRASEFVLRLRLCLAVGQGCSSSYPGSIWYYLRGKFPVPLSVVHPRNNAKGRGDTFILNRPV